LCPQYSVQWWELRAGVPTASAFDRILTPEGKPSRGQDRYIEELIRDRTNPVAGAFSNHRIGTPAMEAGRLAEPTARAFYTFHTNNKVQEVGFVLSECGRFGCSPDGLVGMTARGQGHYDAEGGLELKCPLQKTQMGYLETPDALPKKYRPQVHGQLLCTGLNWVDFLSYADECDPVLVRVSHDEYTDMLKVELDRFLCKLADAIRTP
jgi:hypothetical protein